MLWIVVRHVRDARRILERQTFDDRAVEDAEHHRRETDAERERSGAGGEDARTSAKRTEPLTHVAPERRRAPRSRAGRTRPTPAVGDRFVEALIAQLREELLACRVRTHGRREVGELLVEMLRHLFDQLRFVLRM